MILEINQEIELDNILKKNSQDSNLKIYITNFIKELIEQKEFEKMENQQDYNYDRGHSEGYDEGYDDGERDGKYWGKNDYEDSVNDCLEKSHFENKEDIIKYIKTNIF